MGGKWNVLIIVDNYSRYSSVFFLENKDEVFENFRSLALRLNNEHPNYNLFALTMGPSLEMPLLINFTLSMVLISNFLSCMCLNRMKLWNERTTL
jgi:hypothetical protein